MNGGEERKKKERWAGALMEWGSTEHPFIGMRCLTHMDRTGSVQARHLFMS